MSPDGLTPNPEKVEAIMKFPTPKTKTQNRAVLGMIRYYGRFIEDCSSIAIPLNEFAAKNSTKIWNEI